MEFEYDRSEFMALAFTIKKLKDPRNAQPSDYYDVLNLWQKMDVDIYNVAFEKDTNDVLHVHGRLIVKKNFYKKRLQTFGYHVYTRDIYYEEGWLKYCGKQEDPLEPKIDNKQYMF